MPTPREILLIVLDDVPRNALSAYGASHLLTPHLDSLSADGITFDNAFTTAPLCTPSRFALLTGRYASNASSITAHRPWNIVGFNTFLTGREPTVAHLLRRTAGFESCFVGKYHLGFPLPAHMRTGRAAFGGGGRGLEYAGIAAAVRDFGGFSRAEAVFGGNRQIGSHHPEWMTQQAIDCLRTARARDRPTLILFAPTLPHVPFGLPDSLLANASVTPAGAIAVEPAWTRARAALLQTLDSAGFVCASAANRCTQPSTGGQCSEGRAAPVRVRRASRAERERPGGRTSSLPALSLLDTPWIDPAWLLLRENCEQRRLANLFAAGLAWIDVGVGALLAELRADALVILTADHGASFLGKGSPFEAGIRVPLIMRWAGRLPAGARSSVAVTHLDLAPTILQAAAGPAGQAAASALHGTSLLSAFARDAEAGEEAAAATNDKAQEAQKASAAAARLDARPIFVEIGYARAVRFQNWKLVVVDDPYSVCAGASPYTRRRGLGGRALADAATALGAARSHDETAAAAAPPPPTSCRNLHGQWIERQPHVRFGLGNMTYDAAARHAAFCDRRALYDLTTDPLEQTNLLAQRPDMYSKLLPLLLTHVTRVEAGNPAVRRAGRGGVLKCGGSTRVA